MILRIVVLLLVIPSICLAQTPPSLSSLNWVGCGISKKSYVIDLAKAFEQKTGVHIFIEGGGSTKGIRQVASGEADIGGTCRYTLPDDPREAGVGLEPIAWDALVVITHKDNPVKSITMQQLYDLYAGKITNWKQLGGADAEIKLYTRKSKLSGVGRTLRKLIFADYDYKIASTQSFLSTGPLEAAVVRHPLAISITGVSSARLQDVNMLKLDGVEPSYSNVKSGDYRMYRPLYLVYNPDSSRLPLIKKFIKFCHHRKGRNIMKANGTLPYIDGLPLVMRQIAQDSTAFKRGVKFKLEKRFR